MTLALALLGWAAAFGLLGGTLTLHRMHVERMRLVARACHEIRGPLGAARLGLHLVRDAAVDLELERASLALADLTAARQGLVAPARDELVDLAVLAGEVVAAARPVASRHGAQVALGAVPARGEAVVRGDRRRLAQACANLLRNAAEHGGGLVELAVRVRGGRARVGVEDDGAGLPASVEALAGRRHAGVHGHGLPVAASVAEQHRGRLSAAPSARGAHLVLELPLAR